MSRSILRFPFSKMARSATRAALVLAMLCAVRYGTAQDTPLLSGGVGFLSNTNGGNTTYSPIIEPLIAIPIGDRFLIESRAVLTESFFPNQTGYDHNHFISLTYLQADYLASSHLTIVGGSFLTPFGTFNERLSPLWINNLQDGPLIAGLGAMGTGTGLGGELRGSAISRNKYSIDYVGYFSTRSGNEQFNSERSAGGRVSLYLPENRVEVGLSYESHR